MKISYKPFLALLSLCLTTGLISAQDTVAYYPFSHDARDMSAFENHASVNGAQLTQDRFGVANNAFSFDGETNYLSAPNAAHLNTDLATVAFWVNATEIPGQGEAYLISFGGWQERYKISLPSHGKLIWTTNSDIISDMDAGDGNELQVGVWTHVAMVHDGVMDKIYINGALANQKNVAGNLNATAKDLGIGYNIFEGGSYFNGSLDEVMIFGDALTDQQISDLYAGQSIAPVFSPGVVANYPFNNNFKDQTAFANHAWDTDVTLTTDRFGFGYSAVSLNGTSSHLDIANSAQLNSPATTVSLWVNVGALPDQGEVFLASFGGWQERWKISLPSHGKVVWTTNHTNGISDLDAGDGNELSPGVWKHLVFVHDGAQDRIYIDGALVASKDVVGDLNPTTMPFGIGYSPIDNGLFFNGLMDEVRIYNVGLDDQGVADLYAEQSNNPATPTTLVADFPFTGNANDVTQFGNHGWVDGAVPSIDRFGYGAHAFTFSGAESIEAANSVQYNTDFTTVSFWIRLGALPDEGEAYLMSFGGWQERWKISLPQHGKPVWTTNHTNGISDMDSGDGNELEVGVWTHAVFTHDGAKDKIYLDGALVAEKDVVGTLNSTQYPLGMGYNPIDGGSYFTGDLDDVQLYNVALTDQEVADLYAAQSAPPVFNETLVADYPFTRGAYDETPFRNHGWVNGALPATDRFGHANHSYAFDGVSSGISALNSKQLESPQATVSFWVNPKTLPGQGEVYLISYGGWQERFKISLPSHGKPVWTTNHTNGISDMDSGDGNELQVDTWTHAVFVHDGAKDKIYFNGVMVAEKEVVGDLNSTTYDLGIGYNIIDNANFFDGYLDDVQLYNVALTDQEILDLYNAQSQAPVFADTEAPWAPLNLTGVVTFTNVDLFWLPATDNVGVTGYNVFIDSIPHQTTEETEISIAGLDPLTDYVFGVTAVDSAGNESLMTTLQLTTGVDQAPDTIPPTPPTNLIASVGANSIVVSWDPSTDNQAVAGYIVYLDGIYVDSLDASETSIFIGGLDPETPYYIEVQAFDMAGNLSEFGELEVTTAPPVVTTEEGLVAWYPFEGNANDATPYNNHGVIGGDPVFENVTNRPVAEEGQNIVFDGDMDSVLAPNAVQLISDYTTVSFWIRVDDQNLADAEAYVLDFGHWDERWKISLPQHLKIVWTTNSKNAQFDHAISDMDSGDGNELIMGFWWYVTMVHDGDDDVIYLDGAEVNRKPALGTLNSTARPFCMGNNPIEGGQYFIGALDEVKVYNKALTADEVEKLYTTGTTSVPYITSELSQYIELLYPNPGTDLITLKHGFSNRQDLLIRVYDQSGRQVDAQKFDANALQNGLLSWDVANYPAGYYTLNFVYGGKSLGGIPFVKE